jgi:hypothetical protein
VAFSLLALRTFGATSGWDAAGFWIFAVAALVSAVQFLYLIRVRRHDEPFWAEEEQRRADWDRRGRQL